MIFNPFPESPYYRMFFRRSSNGGRNNNKDEKEEEEDVSKNKSGHFSSTDHGDLDVGAKNNKCNNNVGAIISQGRNS